MRYEKRRLKSKRLVLTQIVKFLADMHWHDDVFEVFVTLGVQ